MEIFQNNPNILLDIPITEDNNIIINCRDEKVKAYVLAILNNSNYDPLRRMYDPS